jgi:sugar phosphate isomerase/epimerase
MRHIVISDCERPEQTAPIARAYGVGLECTTFYDPNFLPEHPGGIEDYLRTTEGISFKTMHGPFAGLSTGVRDRQIRAVTMGRYLEACGTAQALGLRDIVIHNNYYDYCAPRDVWRQNTRDFFRELLERIQDRDVCFHLENTLERDGELIAEVVSTAASPKLDMCLDVGHAQGMVRDGLPALDWVERYGGMIGHVHLHNNCGTTTTIWQTASSPWRRSFRLWRTGHRRPSGASSADCRATMYALPWIIWHLSAI